MQSDIVVLPFKFSNKDFKVIFTTIKLVRYFSNKDKTSLKLKFNVFHENKCCKDKIIELVLLRARVLYRDQ